VIRRGFWLVTGAVLGVTGYRRASRLARALTGQARDASMPPAPLRPASAIQVRWRSPLALTTRAPVRAAKPVRPVERIASAARAPDRAAKPVRPVERITSAAGFVRDVHDGMAEYWDLHRGDRDRTLGSQGPQTASAGASSGRASSSRASAGWAFSGGGERDGREQDRREQDQCEQDRRAP
jgi:hypothetical protein